LFTFSQYGKLLWHNHIRTLICVLIFGSLMLRHKTVWDGEYQSILLFPFYWFTCRAFWFSQTFLCVFLQANCEHKRVFFLYNPLVNVISIKWNDLDYIHLVSKCISFNLKIPPYCVSLIFLVFLNGQKLQWNILDNKNGCFNSRAKTLH